jgi:hypothetical protein
MRIYYYARHTAHKAGTIFKVLHNNDEELHDILLTEDMQRNCRIKLPDANETFADSFYNEYGWEYDSPEYNYVEGKNAEDIIIILTEDIRVWSRRPFNAERAWQIKWRENIIADLTALITKESDLCPICGMPTSIVGITIEDRLIGSCGDAFTKEQWYR